MEKYPPVMNFIYDILTQETNYKISVLTCINTSPFANQEYQGVNILRLGLVTENKILRYLSYLSYNILSVIILFIKRPDVVVVYETLSIFPAYIFSKVFKKKKIHVHFHEYMSIKEKKAASVYVKLLFKCEEKLLKKITCSHTNEDRKGMFLKDNPFLKDESVEVYPNTPPKSWWQDYGQHKKLWQGGKIKLVYVGVMDAETMFLEEVLAWVTDNSQELELTIFSHSISDSANKLLQKFESDSIILKPALNYYQLPSELVKYNIGLVLYNGHTPNYIFNVPNKVFEYLYCGLKVIGDKCLKSTSKLDCSEVLLINLNIELSVKIAFDLIGTPSKLDNIDFDKLNQKFA